MRRTIGALASSLALAATLSACGGDPEPRFEAEPSAAPSTASPSASAEPEPWEERTPEGAVAFAKHWTATFSEAFQTGETTDFERLSDEACETCGDLTALIKDIYGQGGRIDGAPWRLTQPSWSVTDDSNTQITVSGVMQIPEQKFIRPGQEANAAQAATSRFTFVLRYDRNTWIAEKVTREA